MKRSIRNALIAFLSVFIAACGGGSDSALTLPGASSYALTLSASPSTTSSYAFPVTLTAHLVAPDGTTPVTGATVEFASTVGRLSAATAQTNGAGSASTVLFAGSSGSGSGTATVRFTDPDGNVAVQTIAVSTLGDEPTTPGGGTTNEPTITIVVLNSGGTVADASAPVSDTAPGIVRATVLTASGAPASGVIVSFSSGSIASLSQTTAMTDATGVAQVTITATASGAGTASVSATVGTQTLSASTAFATSIGGTTTTGATVSLEVRTSGGVLVDSSNPLTNLSPGTLTATVVQSGSPVPNVLVNFTASTTIASLSQTSALTDSSGKASVSITALSSGAGTATASATVGSATVSTSALFAASVGSTAVDTPIIALEVLDSSGNPINAGNPISNANPGRLRATVTLNSAPVVNTVINYSITTGTTASLSQASAATDTSGVAEVSITATGTGAGTVTADTTVSSTTVSDTQVYSTALQTTPPLVLDMGTLSGAVFTADVLGKNVTTSVAPNSSVTITADIVDTADTTVAYASPVTVTFSSTCVSLGKATIDPSVTTVGGRATAVYRPTGCVGDDLITAIATTSTQTLTATTTVNVTQADVGQIAFLSAEPPVIALAGTGGLGRLERSEVRFQVLGSDGTPLSGKRVCFQLSTTVGGITLSSPFDDSDNSGEVLAVVQAGTIPTPVRVNATLDTDGSCATEPAPVIQTVSDTLVISTGLPDQNSLSLSVEKHTPLAYNYDGVTVKVTARAADHFNNPVPDGTAISFWTELGAIEPSCTTTNGVCEVTWTSQAPRDNADLSAPSGSKLYHDRKGRSTILAYAVGEESFVDINGSGRYETGEPFTDLTEVIKDSNNNGQRDLPGLSPTVFEDEEFVDFDGDLSFDSTNGIFDGVLCGTGTIGTTCSGDATVHVRATNEIVMSANVPRIYVVQPDVDLTGIDFDSVGYMTGIVNPASTMYGLDAFGLVDTLYALRGARTFWVIVTDANGNRPAAGTTISISSNSQSGEPDGTSSYTVPDASGEADWYAATFTIKNPTTPGGIGALTITVKNPDDTKYMATVYGDWSTP